MLYEQDGKAYFDRINEAVTQSRGWFKNVGSQRIVRKKGEMSEKTVSDLLYCDKNTLKVYIKYGFLRSDFIDGIHYFRYDWLEDFALDNRLLNETGEISKHTGFDSPFIIDAQDRLIVTPNILWIDKNEKETVKPNPQSPPIRYVQLVCVYGNRHRHTMGVGWRAQDYHLKPKDADIALMKKYNLYIGEYYSEYYTE